VLDSDELCAEGEISLDKLDTNRVPQDPRTSSMLRMSVRPSSSCVDAVVGSSIFGGTFLLVKSCSRSDSVAKRDALMISDELTLPMNVPFRY